MANGKLSNKPKKLNKANKANKAKKSKKSKKSKKPEKDTKSRKQEYLPKQAAVVSGYDATKLNLQDRQTQAVAGGLSLAAAAAVGGLLYYRKKKSTQKTETKGQYNIDGCLEIARQVTAMTLCSEDLKQDCESRYDATQENKVADFNMNIYRVTSKKYPTKSFLLTKQSNCEKFKTNMTHYKSIRDNEALKCLLPQLKDHFYCSTDGGFNSVYEDLETVSQMITRMGKMEFEQRKKVGVALRNQFAKAFTKLDEAEYFCTNWNLYNVGYQEDRICFYDFEIIIKQKKEPVEESLPDVSEMYSNISYPMTQFTLFVFVYHDKTDVLKDMWRNMKEGSIFPAVIKYNKSTHEDMDKFYDRAHKAFTGGKTEEFAEKEPLMLKIEETMKKIQSAATSLVAKGILTNQEVKGWKLVDEKVPDSPLDPVKDDEDEEDSDLEEKQSEDSETPTRMHLESIDDLVRNSGINVPGMHSSTFYQDLVKPQDLPSPA